jgi:SAM-dependent methyltransferase
MARTRRERSDRVTTLGWPTSSQGAASRPAGVYQTDQRDAPIKTEPVDACPACGSSAGRLWRTDCRDWQQPEATDRFEYVSCESCGARYLSPRPCESELNSVYFAGYEPYRGAPGKKPRRRSVVRSLGASAAEVLRRRLTQHLNETYTPRSPDETLLDYGCGAPTFLDQARDRGFRTIGVDFSEQVVDAVRAKGHEAWLAAAEFDHQVADASFSCVRMNHVVEHLYHPGDTLSAIRKKMRPTGRIHLATPNPHSLGSRLFRSRWHALDCPRHTVLFEPRVLCRLLQRCGFGELEVVQEIVAKDLARSWAIMLYERGRISHERIADFATDAKWSALLLPVSGLAALMSATDRYHVFARRV